MLERVFEHLQRLFAMHGRDDEAVFKSAKGREAVNFLRLFDRAVRFAKQAFGDGVHKHYLNYGQLEQELFDKVVTDYERARLFERG